MDQPLLRFMTSYRKRAAITPILILSFLTASWLFGPTESFAQPRELQTRFGIGLNTVLSVNNGMGLGFRGRVSTPVNGDFSLSIGAGFTGFVLRGRDEASFIFDPQLSGIINIPERGGLAQVYLLAGIGAFVSLTQSSGNESGPSIHFGIGRVQELSESSFFYEINPAVVIGETRVEFVLPFRVGIIFQGN